MEVYQKHQTFSTEEWIDFSNRNLDLLMRMGELNYTSEEWEMIGHIEGQIAGYMTNQTINNIFDRIENITFFSEGFFNGFEKGLDANQITGRASSMYKEIEKKIKRLKINN